MLVDAIIALDGLWSMLLSLRYLTVLSLTSESEELSLNKYSERQVINTFVYMDRSSFDVLSCSCLFSDPVRYPLLTVNFDCRCRVSGQFAWHGGIDQLTLFLGDHNQPQDEANGN
jgi:hypothetical protein